MIATKIESVLIELMGDKSIVGKFPSEIIELGVGGAVTDMMEGDSVKIKYALSILYLQGCEKRLQAIVTLLEAGIINHADLKTLNQAECLFQKLILLIEKVKTHAVLSSK